MTEMTEDMIAALALVGGLVQANKRGVKFERSNGFIEAKDKTINKTVCPLCVAANEVTGNGEFGLDFGLAAKELGIPYEIATEIAAAADSPTRPMREELMEAIGI